MSDKRPMRALRALLIDDHGFVLDAVSGALLASGIVESVDTGRTLQDAQQMLARNGDYGIVVLDLKLEDATGLAALTALRESFPDVPVLVFSGTDSRDVILSALEGGARGYVPKTSPMEVFLGAVRTVLSGSVYVPPRAVRLPEFVGTPASTPAVASAGAIPQLSPRQTDVFRLLMKGMPNKVIAARLGMAEGTVKAHLNMLFRVLQVRNRAQAVLRAHELGMI